VLFQVGKRYLFMTSRYAYSGTVEMVTPTHVLLGSDAQVHYEDVGTFDNWALRQHKTGKSVPGQVICVLGADATPIGSP
jgi:hypothetical protein